MHCNSNPIGMCSNANNVHRNTCKICLFDEEYIWKRKLHENGTNESLVSWKWSKAFTPIHQVQGDMWKYQGTQISRHLFLWLPVNARRCHGTEWMNKWATAAAVNLMEWKNSSSYWKAAERLCVNRKRIKDAVGITKRPKWKPHDEAWQEAWCMQLVVARSWKTSLRQLDWWMQVHL